jgi:hypothetical protein
MGLATPLGLLYNSGAYGEDNPRGDTAKFLHKNHLTAIPAGLNHYANFWHHALFNGYDFSHDKHPSLGYVFSAFFGAAVISLVLLTALGIAKFIRRRRGGRGEDVADLQAVGT